MSFLKYILSSFIALAFTMTNGQTPDLSVCTFNVRWDNPGDGDNQWNNRKEDIVDFVKYYELDVLGLQEALANQVKYLDSTLLDYDWVGVGRDDGKEAGEYGPIFYNKFKFELLDSGTFWLSDSPQKPGIAWDAACSRICTYVKLKNIQSGDKFTVFNTHFDHVGKLARTNSADLIINKIAELGGNDPAILIGDFNLEPDQLPIKKIKSEGLKDAFDNSLIKFGSEGTFNGFNYQKIPTRRIDYVFGSPNIQVLKYRVVSDVIGGRYLSDHFPVLAELTFSK